MFYERTNTTDLPSDEMLMTQIVSGDSRALEQLYSRYSRVVYGLALRILGNPELAEDIVQEAFWRIWNRGATFQAGSGQFAPWIFGITRNLCIDELRRRQARPIPASASSTPDLLLDIPDEQQDVAVLTWESERRRLISGALADLPTDQREAIELAYFAGLTQREIAERLNDPLGTVKTRIRLGLQKLRGLLQRQGIDLE